MMQFEASRFDRTEIIKYIGQQNPTFKDNNVNQLSYFIIPFSHNFFSQKNILELFEKKWKLKNNISKNLPIKKYLIENLLPPINGYKDLNEDTNLLFEYKDLPLNWQLVLKENNNTNYFDFKFTGLDIWIMNHQIGFFVLKMTIDSTLNEISASFNRNLREYRSLNIDFDSQTISNINKTEQNSFSHKLFSLLPKQLAQLTNILGTIDESSFYAKMLTAVHIATDKTSNGQNIEKDSQDLITFKSVHQVSVLDEIAYIMATSSDLFPEKTWEYDDGYLYDQVSVSGINIWKYWAGIALKDSISFFSIAHGGSGIIDQCKNDIYTIYILNLYTYFRLKVYEQKLIDNNFIEIENIHSIYKNIQRLRNEYIAYESSNRFQPNLINNKIKKGLEIQEIYEEITENIKETLEATNINKAVIFAGFAYIWAILSLSIDTKNFINSLSVTDQLSLIIGLFIFPFLAFKYKTYMYRLTSRMLRWVKKPIS